MRAIRLPLCISACVLKHEEQHKTDAKKYFTDFFCKKMNELNTKITCYNSDFAYIFCKEAYKSLKSEFQIEFDNYILTKSEDNAYAISVPCDNDCENY